MLRVIIGVVIAWLSFSTLMFVVCSSIDDFSSTWQTALYAYGAPLLVLLTCFGMCGHFQFMDVGYWTFAGAVMCGLILFSAAARASKK